MLNPLLSEATKPKNIPYEQHKEFFLSWDNDMFVFTDYYYTQGAYIKYIHPGLRKNPANHILLHLKNADNYFGLRVAQQIYTPKDVTDTLLNLVDRPYAGTFFLSSFIASSDYKRKIRLTSFLDIGILGPLAGAKQAQKYIHEWLNLGWPQGWDFQIKNRPYLNYNILLEKGFLNIPNIFWLTGNTRVRLGTVHDDAQLSLNFKVGRTNDIFKGYNLGNKKYTDTNNFELYLFGNAKITGVLYDATLMGGITPPERERYLEFNQIENFVYEACFGLQINYKFAGIRTQLTWKSKEFEMGEKHGWGTISLYFRF
jgi:hypothetical protein